jgi:hypothetical protein
MRGSKNSMKRAPKASPIRFWWPSAVSNCTGTVEDGRYVLAAVACGGQNTRSSANKGRADTISPDFFGFILPCLVHLITI